MSEPVLYLPRAFDDGLAALITDGKTENIYYYTAAGGTPIYKTKWANPEEKVRAELWAELIYKYEYPAENLRIEFAVSDRVASKRADLDTKGVAFEELMSGFFKGDFGQYFTPREPIAFAVELLNPKHTDLTLDPACGSGGSMVYALHLTGRSSAMRSVNQYTGLKRQIQSIPS